MANTYAINTTRGKEFQVESELQELGLHPWVPRRLDSKKIKQHKERVWFDSPYVSKMIFCAFPAVYWKDVCDLKHVIGKPIEISQVGMRGTPAYVLQTRIGPKQIPRRFGLVDFREAVEAEYAEAKRKQANNLYQCTFVPGQAVEVLEGQFEGFQVLFKKAIQRAHEDFARIQVEMVGFGASVIEIDPYKVAAL